MQQQLLRYVLVGICATAIHYAVLWSGMEVLELRSAGVANSLAALVGISCSFLGNRYFVFCTQRQGIVAQGSRFGLLYLSIAIVHGAILYAWTDLMGLDYRIGFLLATAIQFALSFMGNKIFVFK